MALKQQILKNCKYNKDMSDANGRYCLLDNNILPIILALLSDRERLRKALKSNLDYLKCNADDLGGDILIGDGRLTKKYKRYLAETAKALSQSAKVDERILKDQDL